MNVQEISSVIRHCKFNDWAIQIHMDNDRPYLQVHCDNGIDNVTGEKYSWSGRKWLLSTHITETEIVKTALKAVMSAQEHETLEQFKYHDIAIFDPHIKVSDLIEMIENTELDKREDIAP